MHVAQRGISHEYRMEWLQILIAYPETTPKSGTAGRERRTKYV